MADEPVSLPPEPVAPAETPYDPFAWSEDSKKLWATLVAKAQEVQESYHRWWEAALANYLPSVKENPAEYALRVRTNRSFAIVERKKADSFYQRPDLQVSPSPLLETIPNNAAMTAAHAAIMNYKLGRHGVNAKTLFRDMVFAYELFGAGWAKVFYRAYSTDVTRPMNDEMGQPLADEFGEPIMETVPVIVKSECGCEPFSNKQALIPSEFRSTDFDKRAPWLGMRFTMSTREAKGNKLWAAKIPPDFTGSSSGSGKAQFFESGAQPATQGDPVREVVTGTEIYYRSSLFRDDVVNPDALTKLVLIDGIDEPVEHRDDPDQTIDEQGRLTPDSRIGFPYHALIIRTLTDSAYVMSDVAGALPLTQELDKYRVQGVRQRDINLVKFFYDTSKLSPDEVDKFVSSEQGGMVGVPPEAFNDPQGPIRALANAPIPPDNYSMGAVLDHDLSQAFAVDANAAGTTSSGSQTATETNVRQANVNVRQGSEQSFVADCYISLAEKLSSLVQRYLSVEDAAEVVGQQKAMAWDSWRRAIPTRLAFKMTPDSSLRNDTPLERMQIQQLFTYVANDPNVNRRYFLEKVFQKFHIDPAQAMLAPDQMPKKADEPPRISFNADLKYMDPRMPQFWVAVDWMAKSGKPLSPQTIEWAKQVAGVQTMAGIPPEGMEQPQGETETEHGGKLPPMESLDKHLAERTGAQSNTGEPMQERGGINVGIQ